MSRPVAIVTGACQGIGRAIAEALAERSFDLAVTDLAPQAEGEALLKDLARRGCRALYQSGDIADLATHAPLVERALAEFGHIDCLVNNAGMGAVVRGDLLDLAPENFDRIMAVNLRGTVFLTQAVVSAMLSRPPADAPRSIVTITSVSAELASSERIDYCMSKGALAMWVRGLALRLAPEGVGVFDVRPGIVRSAMTAKVAAAYDERIAAGLVPARRWGETGDVATVVASLACGDFAFATGSVIAVDGGLSIPRL
ncbi:MULTISPECIES: 3-ketoacyl-ACP reductase [unclassified Bradyrhizobium]|uniref:3-ketoacyl-ACP reductase n=1 Tax=unclassified Bradyrhizobium TaxID=2631580 RepID=UPI001FFC1907|nr:MULTISPECIES: 3-ketoacyl-ACP reductase [unclassified Bradyrhizobium]MCK1708330.1 3-ketoacyl-ACP reductase [Bradyrhizobium sp. 143]MCK1724182.1 3-ketoacyl-ACP reductase [Bradyrhizobium sp. 142]